MDPDTIIYDKKLAELRKYLSFLEDMEDRLKSLGGDKIVAQLTKIQGLKNLIKGDKRMKMENLVKCEAVLVKLYKKTTERMTSDEKCDAVNVDTVTENVSTVNAVNVPPESPEAIVVEEESVSRKLNLNFYKEQSEVENNVVQNLESDVLNKQNELISQVSEVNETLSVSQEVDVPKTSLTFSTDSPFSPIVNESPLSPDVVLVQNKESFDSNIASVPSEDIPVNTSEVVGEINTDPVSKVKENQVIKKNGSGGQQISTIMQRFQKNKKPIKKSVESSSDVDMRTPFSDVDMRFSGVFIDASLNRTNLINCVDSNSQSSHSLEVIPPPPPSMYTDANQSNISTEISNIPVLLNCPIKMTTPHSNVPVLLNEAQTSQSVLPLFSSDSDLRVINTGYSAPAMSQSLSDFNIPSVKEVRNKITFLPNPQPAAMLDSDCSIFGTDRTALHSIVSRPSQAIINEQKKFIKSCVVAIKPEAAYKDIAQLVSLSLRCPKPSDEHLRTHDGKEPITPGRRNYTRVLVSPARSTNSDYRSGSRKYYSRSPSPRRRRRRSRSRDRRSKYSRDSPKNSYSPRTSHRSDRSSKDRAKYESSPRRKSQDRSRTQHSRSKDRDRRRQSREPRSKKEKDIELLGKKIEEIIELNELRKKREKIVQELQAESFLNPEKSPEPDGCQVSKADREDGELGQSDEDVDMLYSDLSEDSKGNKDDNHIEKKLENVKDMSKISSSLIKLNMILKSHTFNTNENVPSKLDPPIVEEEFQNVKSTPKVFNESPESPPDVITRKMAEIIKRDILFPDKTIDDSLKEASDVVNSIDNELAVSNVQLNAMSSHDQVKDPLESTKTQIQSDCVTSSNVPNADTKIKPATSEVIKYDILEALVSDTGKNMSEVLSVIKDPVKELSGKLGSDGGSSPSLHARRISLETYKEKISMSSSKNTDSVLQNRKDIQTMMKTVLESTVLTKFDPILNRSTDSSTSSLQSFQNTSLNIPARSNIPLISNPESSPSSTSSSVEIKATNVQNKTSFETNSVKEALTKARDLFSQAVQSLPPWATPVDRDYSFQKKKHVYATSFNFTANTILSPEPVDVQRTPRRDSSLEVVPPSMQMNVGASSVRSDSSDNNFEGNRPFGTSSTLTRPNDNNLALSTNRQFNTFSPRSGFETPDRHPNFAGSGRQYNSTGSERQINAGVSSWNNNYQRNSQNYSMVSPRDSFVSPRDPFLSPRDPFLSPRETSIPRTPQYEGGSGFNRQGNDSFASRDDVRPWNESGYNRDQSGRFSNQNSQSYDKQWGNDSRDYGDYSNVNRSRVNSNDSSYVDNYNAGIDKYGSDYQGGRREVRPFTPMRDIPDNFGSDISVVTSGNLSVDSWKHSNSMQSREYYQQERNVGCRTPSRDYYENERGRNTPCRDSVVQNSWMSDNTVSTVQDNNVRFDYNRETTSVGQSWQKDDMESFSNRTQQFYNTEKYINNLERFQRGRSVGRQDFQMSTDNQRLLHEADKYKRARSVGRSYLDNETSDVQNWNAGSSNFEVSNKLCELRRKFERSRSVQYKVETVRSSLGIDSMFPVYSGDKTLRLEHSIDKFSSKDLRRARSLARDSKISNLSCDVKLYTTNQEIEGPLVTKPMQKAIELIKKSKQSQNIRDPRLIKKLEASEPKSRREDPRLLKHISRKDSPLDNKREKERGDSRHSVKDRDDKTHIGKDKHPRNESFSHKDRQRSNSKHRSFETKTESQRNDAKSHKSRNADKSSKVHPSKSHDAHRSTSHKNERGSSNSVIKKEYCNQREKISSFKIPKLKKVEKELLPDTEVEKTTNPSETNPDVLNKQSVVSVKCHGTKKKTEKENNEGKSKIDGIRKNIKLNLIKKKPSQEESNKEDNQSTSDVDSPKPFKPRKGRTIVVDNSSDEDNGSDVELMENMTSDQAKLSPKLKQVDLFDELLKSDSTIAKENTSTKTVKIPGRRLTIETPVLLTESSVDGLSKPQDALRKDSRVRTKITDRNITNLKITEDSEVSDNSLICSTQMEKELNVAEVVKKESPLTKSTTHEPTNQIVEKPKNYIKDEELPLPQLINEEVTIKKSVSNQSIVEIEDKISEHASESDNSSVDSPLKSRLRRSTRQIAKPVLESPLTTRNKKANIVAKKAVSVDVSDDNKVSASDSESEKIVVKQTVQSTHKLNTNVTKESSNSCLKVQNSQVNIDEKSKADSTVIPKKSENIIQDAEKKDNQTDLTGLVEILKNKHKMLEILAMLSGTGDGVSDKIKKKLEKLAEIDSDDEDNVKESKSEVVKSDVGQVVSANSENNIPGASTSSKENEEVKDVGAVKSLETLPKENVIEEKNIEKSKSNIETIKENLIDSTKDTKTPPSKSDVINVPLLKGIESTKTDNEVDISKTSGFNISNVKILAAAKQSETSSVVTRKYLNFEFTSGTKALAINKQAETIPFITDDSKGVVCDSSNIDVDALLSDKQNDSLSITADTTKDISFNSENIISSTAVDTSINASLDKKHSDDTSSTSSDALGTSLDSSNDRKAEDEVPAANSEVQQSKTTKKKSKGTRELQMLHEYNFDMFISADILKATGVRSCTLANLDRSMRSDGVASNETNPVKPTPKTTENKVTRSAEKIPKPSKVGKGKKAKAGTAKSKNKNVSSESLKQDDLLLPRVVVLKTPIMVPKDVYEYSEDNSVVEDYQLVKQKPCPKSKKIIINSSTTEEIHEATSDINVPEVKKGKKLKTSKKRNLWQSGVIKRSKKIQKNSSKVRKESNLCDMDYCFNERIKEYKCKMCYYAGPNIVKHYKLRHPHSEVIISRLIREQANMTSGEVIVQSKNKSQKLRMYRCRFCMKLFRVKNLRIIFDHIVYNHTGEYKHTCSVCSTKDNKKCISVCNKSSTLPPADDFIDSVSGYMCSLCNYTQLSHENLKTHIWLRHFNEECELKEINLTLGHARRRMLKSGLEVAKTEDTRKKKLEPRVTTENIIPNRLRNVQSPKVVPKTVKGKPAPKQSSSPKKPPVAISEIVPPSIPPNDIEPNVPDDVITEPHNVLTEPQKSPNADHSSVFHASAEIANINIKQEIQDDQLLEETPLTLEDVDIKTEKLQSQDNSLSDTPKITKVGLIEMRQSSGKSQYFCNINRCNFTCDYLLIFMSHVNSHDFDWNGFCDECNLQVYASNLIGDLTNKYSKALEHLLSTHQSTNEEKLTSPMINIKQEALEKNVGAMSERHLNRSLLSQKTTEKQPTVEENELNPEFALRKSTENEFNQQFTLTKLPKKELKNKITLLKSAKNESNEPFKSSETELNEQFALRKSPENELNEQFALRKSSDKELPSNQPQDSMNFGDSLSRDNSMDYDPLVDDFNQSPESATPQEYNFPKINVRSLKDLMETESNEHVPSLTADSSGLCQLRIENVVSLNPNAEKVTPTAASENIDSLVPENNTVQETENIDNMPNETIPVPTTQTDISKVFISQITTSGKTVQKTQLPLKLNDRRLFRCSQCPWSNDDIDLFIVHLGTHKKVSNCCSYCDMESCSKKILADHILSAHGASRFSCLLCGYRACVPLLVVTHGIAYHKVKMLSIGEIKIDRKIDDLALVRGLLPKKKCIQPYSCTYDGASNTCGKSFYSVEAFDNHLKTHPPRILKCQICSLGFLAPTLKLHLKKVHNFKVMVCSYCALTFDTKTEALAHLMSKHSGRRPLLYVRLYVRHTEFVNRDKVVLLNLDKGDTYPNLITFNADGSVQTNTERVNTSQLTRNEINMIIALEEGSNTNESLLPVSETQSSSSSSGTSKENTTIEISSNNASRVSTPVANVSPNESDKNPSTSASKQNPDEDTDVIIVDSDDEGSKTESTHGSVTNASRKSIDDVFSIASSTHTDEDTQQGKNILEKQQLKVSSMLEHPFIFLTANDLSTFISGAGIGIEELYRCGNKPCDYLASSSANFKDHLVICEHAREFDMLSCCHCSKEFRNTSRLMDHIRTHGAHRYQCNVCYYCSWGIMPVTQHMRKAHKLTNIVTMPLVPFKNDHDSDFFVLKSVSDKGNITQKRKPGPKSKVQPQPTPVAPVITSNKKSFGPDEIKQLPLNPILSEEIFCKLCNFGTKVRSNLLRHLQMHANEVEVPSVAPINPVPHLETNEMHFDKMANLALSSNINKPVEKSSAKSTKSETMNYPKYIPEKERFVCGSVGCQYTSVDETMLRFHWKTLHSEESVYHCVHCGENVAVDGSQYQSTGNIAAHLRLHEEELHGCTKCSFTNPLPSNAEKHSIESHGKDFSMCIRKIKTVNEENTAAELWQCNLCPFKATAKDSIASHCNAVHKIKHPFKCSLCYHTQPTKILFGDHFAKKHSTQSPEVVAVYSKVNEGDEQQDKTVDNTPLWWKQRKRASIFSEEGLSQNSDNSSPSSPSPAKTAKITRQTESSSSFSSLVLPKYGSVEIEGYQYKCPFCLKFTSESYTEMRIHIYEEVNYRNWECVACGYKSFSSNKILEHSKTNHGKAQTKLLKPNQSLEMWVEGCLQMQEKSIKANKEKALKEYDIPDEPALVIDEEISKPNSQKQPQQPQQQQQSPSKLPGEAQCPYCDFSSVNGVLRHMKRHWKVKPMGCGYCDEGFVRRIELNSHINKRHTGKPYLCKENVLPKVPEIVPLLRYKRKTYPTTTPPVKTGEESQGTPQKIRKLSVSPKTHVCLSCEIQLSAEEVINHKSICSAGGKYPAVKKNSMAIKCSICMQLTPDVELFYTHFDEEHHGMEINYVIHSVGKPKSKRIVAKLIPIETPPVINENVNHFTCMYCYEKFTSYLSYVTHHGKEHIGKLLRFIPMIIRKFDNAEEIRAMINKNLECCIIGCYFEASNASVLLSHIRSHYITYKCHFCNATFSIYKFYQEHSQNHTNMICKNQDEFTRDTITQDRLMKIFKYYKDKHVFSIGDEQLFISQDKLELISNATTSQTTPPTTTNTPHKINQVARKSTTDAKSLIDLKSDKKNSGSEHSLSATVAKQPSPSEYSFYGTKPAPIDLKKISISVEFFGTKKTINVEQLTAIENLFPNVSIEDYYN